MRLSKTPEAASWLRQFEDADRQTAEFFLDTLQLVPPMELERRTRELVEYVAGREKAATALYAAREITEEEKRYSLWHDDSTRPSVSRGAIPLGSEGSAAHRIGDLSRGSNGRLLNHPSLHTLRQNRCRNIVILDDMIGSGKRVSEYVQAMYRNPTIKSWHSYGWIRFHVIAYAVAEIGHAQLARFKPSVRLHYDREIPQGRAFWSARERAEVESLCRKYAPLTSKPTIPLGYRKTFACIVFHYACPNGAPVILWQAGRKKWTPLFPNRSVPTGLVRIFEPVNANPPTMDVLRGIGQKRLAEGTWPAYVTASYHDLVVVIAAVAKGQRLLKRLGDITGFSKQKCEFLMEQGRSIGWLSAENRITAQGRAELEYARQVGDVEPDCPPLKNDFYFPSSLRKTRGPL